MGSTMNSERRADDLGAVRSRVTVSPSRTRYAQERSPYTHRNRAPKRVARALVLIRALLCGSLVVTAAMATSTPALADDVARREAQARFKEGVDAYKRQDYETARHKFTQANAVLKAADILINLALAELRSNHPLEALAHFREYERHPKADPASLKSLPVFIADAYQKTGHIKIEAPSGVVVSIDIAAATSSTGDVVDVMPGQHVAIAKLSNGEKRIVLDAPAGEVVVARFDAPVPATAVPIGSAAVTPSAPPTAPSTVRAPLAGADTPPASPGFWTTRRFVGVAVTGAGVVALGASAYFASLSNDAAGRASTLHASVGPTGCSTGVPQCAQMREAYDSETRNRTISTVFITTGIAAATTGIVIFFWPEASPHAAVVPMVSPSSGGLQLHGVF